jgi:hypothetical protein
MTSLEKWSRAGVLQRQQTELKGGQLFRSFYQQESDLKRYICCQNKDTTAKVISMFLMPGSDESATY